jgi:F0F1-type ATP synthase assembly protein I
VKKVKEMSTSTSSAGRIILAMVIVTFLQMVSGVLVGLALGMSILFSAIDGIAKNSIWSQTY